MSRSGKSEGTWNDGWREGLILDVGWAAYGWPSDEWVGPMEMLACLTIERASIFCTGATSTRTGFDKERALGFGKMSIKSNRSKESFVVVVLFS